MILGRGLDSPREVGVDAATVGVKVTGTKDTLTSRLLSSLEFVTIEDHLQSLPGTVQQGLTKRLVLRNGLENVPVCCHVADSPLAQPEHHRLALLYNLLYILQDLQMLVLSPGAGQSEHVAPGFVDVPV